MNPGLAVESFRFDNEQKWFELMLKVDYFTSVNSLYGVNRRTGAIYMLPEPRYMKSVIQEQITYLDPVSKCPWIYPDSIYKVSYKFILKTEFWKRDIDNMVKVIQDGIFECLHVNDARIIEASTKKLLNSKSQFEYLILAVGISEFDYLSLIR